MIIDFVHSSSTNRLFVSCATFASVRMTAESDVHFAELVLQHKLGMLCSPRTSMVVASSKVEPQQGATFLRRQGI